MPPQPRVLGVFAKWPVPGQVKTRLAAATSPEWAARVADAFLQDTLDSLMFVPARRVLACAPADTVPNFTELVRGRFEVVPQSTGHLGERMAAFFMQQLASGSPVVLIGTDSPTLPTSYIEQAFHELERADVVLGPATDGGYYLVGCTQRLPPLFDGVAWSSTTTLAESIARLSDPAWRLALLPPWYDVDTVEDWQVLRGHLAALRRAGIDPGVPRTESLATVMNSDSP